MFRLILNDLEEWKNSKRRKPLLLQGARQVGKTYIIEEFAKAHYKHLVKINFEFHTDIHVYFEKTLDPHVLLEKLGLFFGQNIKAENTLLFFDEIQACPRAITSLKYFYENAPDFHLVAAGSLLGVSVGNSNFPVGKVNFLHLYPMSFYEFLHALDMSMVADQLIKSPNKIDSIMHEKLMEQMKIFVYVGGMPEAVASYIANKDPMEVATIHQEILQAYERDFIKYVNPHQAIKTQEIWNSIPYQLGKENKKFKYSDVKSKARAANYDTTIEWLKSAGLIHVVNQIRTSKLPLKGYEDAAKFKIYLLDTGLLSNLLHINSSLVVKGNELFAAYNGALTENFICNEIIKTQKTIPQYWVSNSEAEVDFVFQCEAMIVPLEVKSGLDRNTKSLRSYQKSENSKYVFRVSPRKYSESEDGFINLGLYAVMGIKSILMEIGNRR